MSMQYQAAPHRMGEAPLAAPNAALLIDFDNVTMGMRSDLSKDLKKLLDSDIIRGKVTVQRAYADWRRYPQYIVPLSENSIDLIFAPAYGSSKKNATDIRMAIDGMELVFTRPEIGTFILLTGDSDFSSLVLKLKEYGKYVIGVGIQESSSDILVQNCDEYYSYTNIAGLQKTTDADKTGTDPWVLVDKAIKRMADRGDVMRSDRLKQVMMELDPSFDESSYGFGKFSRFLAEASSRDLVQLKRAENGQYDVAPGKGSPASTSSTTASSSSSGRGRGRGRKDSDRGRGGRGRGRGRSESSADTESTTESKPEAQSESKPAREERAPAAEASPAATTSADGFAEGVQGAYEILISALDRLKEAGRYPARGSDVKRRMLEVKTGFDEAEYGFPKFSAFLKAAEDDGVITVERLENGGFEVEVGEKSPAEAAGGREGTSSAAADESRDSGAPQMDRSSSAGRQERDPEPPKPEPKNETVVEEMKPEAFVSDDTPGRQLGPRGGTTRRRADGPPPLFEGQGRPAATTQKSSAPEDSGTQSSQRSESSPAQQDARSAPPAPTHEELDDDVPGEPEHQEVEQPDFEFEGETFRGQPAENGHPEIPETIVAEDLGLPTDRDAQVSYLTNSYKGIGEKTAETIVDAFGERVFEVLNAEPEKIRALLSPARADQLLEAWEEDIQRRVVRMVEDT